ncbi:hypothetical protein L596_028097 [Steinernema carpocapsae]|uniref:Neurotransmitter-gated ion-channel ligand-binding domain-containing protein n=1 Tax=Steinernema carpocapsae TaxID=34508 RepID=A0A4U5LXF5_STECR|nr:hypothetical protein L596_028097 [Steinernema carpocapsae]
MWLHPAIVFVSLAFLSPSGILGEPSPLKNNSKSNEYHRLYTDLFADYVKEIRPVLNDSQSLTVSVQFWLKQILKVDERDQIVNIYLWLELYWTDEFLKWDPKDYDGLDRLHIPSESIWRPDILVYNNANMNVNENELDTNVIVDHTGLITLFRSMITDITCTLNLREFPFDQVSLFLFFIFSFLQQICHLTLASWTYDGSKINLKPMNGTDNLDYYIKNSEWSLTDYALKTYEKIYDCCPYAYPDITYFIVIKRSPSYYIFSLVIPSAFITVVTIVGFFTPHSTTGENTEKVSLGVTALLSMAIIMMMVSDEVPATSEIIPLIGKYYIGLIFIIFLAAYTTTLTLAFQMRGNAGIRLNPWLKYVLFERVARNPWLNWIVATQLNDQKNVITQKNGKTEMTYVFDVDTVDHNVYRRGAVSDAEVIVNRHQGAFVKRTRVLGEKRGSSGLELEPVDCPNQNCILHILHRMKERLDTVESFIFYRHYLRQILNEWEQATRIIDRFIMIFYIITVVVFAMVMLLGGPEDIVLTEELMDKAVNS